MQYVCHVPILVAFVYAWCPNALVISSEFSSMCFGVFTFEHCAEKMEFGLESVELGGGGSLGLLESSFEIG
jgi:hypothetical protein